MKRTNSTYCDDADVHDSETISRLTAGLSLCLIFLSPQSPALKPYVGNHILVIEIVKWLPSCTFKSTNLLDLNPCFPLAHLLFLPRACGHTNGNLC
jgi:hypothetical protein